MAVDQARLSVGMMVRTLNGEKPGKDFPFRAGPIVKILSRANISIYPFERLFGPRNFTPVFLVKQ